MTAGAKGRSWTWLNDRRHRWQLGTFQFLKRADGVLGRAKCHFRRIQRSKERQPTILFGGTSDGS